MAVQGQLLGRPGRHHHDAGRRQHHRRSVLRSHLRRSSTRRTRTSAPSSGTPPSRTTCRSFFGGGLLVLLGSTPFAVRLGRTGPLIQEPTVFLHLPLTGSGCSRSASRWSSPTSSSSDGRGARRSPPRPRDGGLRRAALRRVAPARDRRGGRPRHRGARARPGSTGPEHGGAARRGGHRPGPRHLGVLGATDIAPSRLEAQRWRGRGLRERRAWRVPDRPGHLRHDRPHHRHPDDRQGRAAPLLDRVETGTDTAAGEGLATAL